MSDMIERVARAIAKERGIDPDRAIVTYEAKGGILLPREQYEWPTLLREAHAAIEAMRGPAQDVLDELAAIDDLGSKAVWQAAIDKALGK